MATLTKRLKNSTGTSFDLKGSTFEPSVYVNIDLHDDVDWRNDSDVIAKITSGDLVMNDGTNDLNIADGLLWLSYDPEEALSTKFQSDSERSNLFASDNVQDAIEEARNSAIGTLIEFHFNSGGSNVNNAWLAFGDPSAPSNDVPMVAPQNLEIKGLVFSNKDDNSDTDMEIYCNGTLSATVEIRAKRYYWKVGATITTVNQGDRVSVFLKKYGTVSSAPSKPNISLYCKVVKEMPADDGEENGD